eukprot:COSAG01_NODE_12457_length_1735_cov_1.248166_2_plen_211_part_00
MDKVLSMKAMVHDFHACSPSDFARQWPCEAVRAAMEMNTAVPSQAKAAQVLAQAQKAVDAAVAAGSTAVATLPATAATVVLERDLAPEPAPEPAPAPEPTPEQDLLTPCVAHGSKWCRFCAEEQVSPSAAPSHSANAQAGHAQHAVDTAVAAAVAAAPWAAAAVREAPEPATELTVDEGLVRRWDALTRDPCEAGSSDMAVGKLGQHSTY